MADGAPALPAPAMAGSPARRSGGLRALPRRARQRRQARPAPPSSTSLPGDPAHRRRAATTLRSAAQRARAGSELVVIRWKSFADPLGEILRGQTRLVAFTPELLDGHVAGRVDLGPRDDPGRAILVPNPDVLHAQVEERVAWLRDVLEVELVAEVCGVLREHAVAEEAEDGRVLLLQRKLELGLELVELVDVRHEGVILAPRARPRPVRGRAPRGRDRGPRAAPIRSAARAGARAEPRDRAL